MVFLPTALLLLLFKEFYSSNPSNFP